MTTTPENLAEAERLAKAIHPIGVFATGHMSNEQLSHYDIARQNTVKLLAAILQAKDDAAKAEIQKLQDAYKAPVGCIICGDPKGHGGLLCPGITGISLDAQKPENLIHNDTCASGMTGKGEAPEPWLNDKYALSNKEHKRIGGSDKQHAAWLADKIHALGDYAKEAATMLNQWPDEQEVAQKARKAALEEAAIACENVQVSANDLWIRTSQLCARCIRKLIGEDVG